MAQIIVNERTRERRFALVKKNRVEQIFIDSPKHRSQLGSIYLGSVTKVLPGLNAAFVDLGEEKEGFIHRDELKSFLQDEATIEEKQKRSISHYVHQGEKILVQVNKDATGEKGPRLTGNIELPSSRLVYKPFGQFITVSKKIEQAEIRDQWLDFGLRCKTNEEGILFRTEAGQTSEAEMAEELNQLRAEFQAMLSKAKQMKKAGLVNERNLFFIEIVAAIEKYQVNEVIVDDLQLKIKLEEASEVQVTFYQDRENIFIAYRIEEEIQRALNRVVPLSSGAYLVIDETEAMTVIDVNTGKFSGKNQLQDTVVKTNELAAEEIARQLRLRNSSGMILIDFIDMKSEKDRKQVTRKMEQLLREDDRRTNIRGFTALGIMELTRKRTRVSLSEALTVSCPTCDGTGKMISPESVAFQMERALIEHRYGDFEAVWLIVSKSIVELYIGENKEYKRSLEEMLGFKLIFTGMESDKPFYQIRQFGLYEELILKERYED